jgi:hypothetical protein
MKKPKLPKPRKIVRNPYARVLSNALFRKRVVKRADIYRRRPKHRRGPTDAEES